MELIPQWRLRAAFAQSLSSTYGREVPAYTTLVEVSREVNADVARERGQDAERLGSIERVTAERHGAIRVGTPRELAEVARLFAGFGMHPVGYYDLREAAPAPVPVVSTAFRPVEPDELARNPFRVFTSVLATSDRRFFDADLQARLEAFLARRTLFSPELLALADRAAAQGGLTKDDADALVHLATQVFALSDEPVDRAWHAELERVSPVAADIGGVRSTHINHLTPRVLDIDQLYARMQQRGIQMIDAIQGPPRWDGPDVLLRQTSFRALDEPRRFVDAEGNVSEGFQRVRFGEVEARGVALTRTGRELYDRMMAEVDARAADPQERAAVARSVWRQNLPSSEAGLAEAGLAYFTYRLDDDAAAALRADGGVPPADVEELVREGWAVREPLVYEDFLPASAAGIFQSNLTSRGHADSTRAGSALDTAWMAGVLDRPWHDPFDLYDRQQQQSIDQLERDIDERRPR